MIKSRAAVAFAPNEPLKIVEVDVAPPKAGEVLVRIVATGVCHADAYTLRHVNNLTWDQVATALDEPVAVVKDWAQTYIDRTDAAAAEQQMSLFD